jgi:hypothetical protein
VGAFCVAAILAIGAPLRAQTIFMTAPPSVAKVQIKGPSSSAPSSQVAPRGNSSPAAKTPIAVSTGLRTEGPLAPGAVLRHLTNNIQGYRLAGEIGASEWPIYLTLAQARRKLQFQLGYLAAVSVMPEASTLTLMLNDEVVGVTQISAFTSVKTVVFDIPTGLMRAGFNSVRISTDQRHRVDCSVEATFELWTQIDPTQTGLILDEADAGIDNLADLGALLPDEQGALPIRAVLPQNAQPATVVRMLRAVQMISIMGRFEQPVVDAGPLLPGRYGVNLLVGPANQLIGQVGFDNLGVVDRPRAVVLPATPERRTTIIITGTTLAQVDEAMNLFLVATTPKGAPAGLRAAAAFPGYRLEGGQRIKMHDLGLVSEEFSGRLFRTGFNIIMPPDFYPADYGRATLRVGGGYASGLSSRAQLVVNVNERTAVSLSLLKTSGEVFKDNPLPLPLGFFRPGLNRVEIEAHVPTKGDDNCDPLSAIDAPNRFLFLDQTEIELPAIARVARIPDLAVTATGGFPYAGSAVRPKLFLPSFDEKSIGAALTVAAHLAIAAGRPIDFDIAAKPPGKGQGPTLAVAPFDAFDSGLLQKLAMPIADLREAWKDRIGAPPRTHAEEILSQTQAAARNRLVLQNNFPMACHAGLHLGTKHSALNRARFANIDYSAVASLLRNATNPNDLKQALAAQPTRDLFGEWDAKMRNETSWSHIVVSWFVRMREWGVAKFTDAGSWMSKSFDSTDGDSRLLTPDSLLAVGQNVVGDGVEDVWTVVTAPNADDLADAVGCLVDPRVSRQIAGRLSVLDVARARMNITPVDDPHFVATQPLSVGNVRLIAAGWLSLHALAYVLGAVTLAILLAAATRLFVRNIGRRAD